MSDFRGNLDQTADAGISFATWQDRQLSVILARTEQLLRELRAATSAVGGERHEELSRELGRATALLEVREAELRKLAQQGDALRSDVEYWQAKAAALGRQLEEQTAIQTDLRAGEQRLQEEVARLSSVETLLSSRVNSSAYEAATLRRSVAELQSSLSWRITAPLRFLTKPLFRLVAPAVLPLVIVPAARPPAPPSGFANHEGAIEASVSSPATGNRFTSQVEAILPELRRAQSIAVIPCAIPFSSTLNQRPISCARYLADHGYTVLYVAWQWFPEEEVPRAWEEVYPHVFHLPLYGFQGSIESIASASYAKGSYLCTLPSPGLVEVVRPLRAAGYHIHYDIMDDWEEFHRGGEAPWFSAGVEREMVILADTVTAVSDKLAQKFDHLRSDIAVVRNGYQPSALACDQFIAAHTPLGSPKVVGYFGHFSDAWFDWDTLIYAAQKLPGVEFELIGWGISEPTRMRLSQLPNIRLPGIVPQNELHRYARNWWAGMIPFQPSAVSAAVDPLKIYEYLHLGLPTVVTGISGIASYPLVQFAEDRESFVAALGQITNRPDEQRLSEVAEFLKACVWEERFARLNSMLVEPAGLAFLYAR
jgi:glycosyltransferase involved in cell wall biosynthesis